MGVFIQRGPGRPQGQRAGLRMLDVAPTILSWFNLPPVDGCDGRVLDLRSFDVTKGAQGAHRSRFR